MIDLSVTIIGRNESATLGKALRSVSGIAREIIFVDTGANDDTVQIAREYGARIFHFEWRDDFAEGPFCLDFSARLRRGIHAGRR